MDYIEQKPTALGRDAFIEHFREKTSPGFDPDRDLLRIGIANQTTMLANESLGIGAAVKQSMIRRHGDAYVAQNFRSFDTICSATQERQDAIIKMMMDPPDVMVVIGGYNSSNTISLAAICADRVPTYHVEDAACIEVERGVIRHQAIGTHTESEQAGWLSPVGPVRVGLTAGASTPNNKIGEAVARIFATRGVDPASVS
jgi:4-hydroxy-3-methylbut-2-enyl diphosphate reductase